MHMRFGFRILVLASALLALSCGGVAGLVLKTPITSKCEESGLQGCPELVEGMLLYVEGNKGSAAPKLKAAAAANSPKELVEFAAAIKMLESIPSLAQYMGPVIEVTTIIVDSAKSHRTDGGKSHNKGKNNNNDRNDGTTNNASAGIITADTDSAQLRTITFSISQHPKIKPCGDPDPDSFHCVRVGRGPFVLTDFVAAKGCSVFAFAREAENEERVWRIDAGPDTHGMRLVVTSKQTLVIGATGSGEDCQVTWSGFKPYR